MIGKAQILNPNAWKIQNHQFKVWKRPYPHFKWLEKQEIKNSTVWKNQNPQIAMLGKAQILNSNICKSQHAQFQWLEKPKSWIPTFGKH